MPCNVIDFLDKLRSQGTQRAVSLAVLLGRENYPEYIMQNTFRFLLLHIPGQMHYLECGRNTQTIQQQAEAQILIAHLLGIQSCYHTSKWLSQKLGTVVHAINSTGRLAQEDQELKASLGYIVRPPSQNKSRIKNIHKKLLQIFLFLFFSFFKFLIDFIKL